MKEYKIDVFHDEITVKFLDGWAQVDGETVWGFYDGPQRTIQISKTTLPRMRSSLLHEYFHACIGVMHGSDTVKGEDMAEEMCVRACEMGIVHLYRTPKNKWLVKYIFGTPL